ncbi:MAG: hypothetical protein RLZZ536_2759, partial [Planctomycetota bacterium]
MSNRLLLMMFATLASLLQPLG